MKPFKFPIRTTPEGSIDPYAGKPAADMPIQVLLGEMSIPMTADGRQDLKASFARIVAAEFLPVRDLPQKDILQLPPMSA